MKVGVLTSRVETLYAKGVPNDESQISARHIYVKALGVRKLLVSRQIKKRQKISDWNYTILPCVELIKVPASECSCLTDLGCDVYRTKYSLPKPLTNSNVHMIEHVMSVDSGLLLNEISRQQVLYLKGNKYTSAKPKYVFENNHLYFPVQKSPGVVKIKLLAEDPIEAQKYPSMCEDCPECVDCTPMTEYDFPIDGELEEPLIEMCVAELLEWYAARMQRGRGRNDDTQDYAEDRA